MFNSSRNKRRDGVSKHRRNRLNNQPSHDDDVDDVSITNDDDKKQPLSLSKTTTKTSYDDDDDDDDNNDVDDDDSSTINAVRQFQLNKSHRRRHKSRLLQTVKSSSSSTQSSTTMSTKTKKNKKKSLMICSDAVLLHSSNNTNHSETQRSSYLTSSVGMYSKNAIADLAQQQHCVSVAMPNSIATTSDHELMNNHHQHQQDDDNDGVNVASIQRPSTYPVSIPSANAIAEAKHSRSIARSRQDTAANYIALQDDKSRVNIVGRSFGEANDSERGAFVRESLDDDEEDLLAETNTRHKSQNMNIDTSIPESLPTNTKIESGACVNEVVLNEDEHHHHHHHHQLMSDEWTRGDIINMIKTKLDTLKAKHAANMRLNSSALINMENLNEKIIHIDSDIFKADSKYKELQILSHKLQNILSLLAVKIGSLDDVERELRELWADRAEALQDAIHTHHTDMEMEAFADRGLLADRSHRVDQVDEFGRPLAHKEEVQRERRRRARERRRCQAQHDRLPESIRISSTTQCTESSSSSSSSSVRDTSHLCGWTTLGDTDIERESEQMRIKVVDEQLESIFDDVADEFRSVDLTLHLFAQWRHNSPDTYVSAFCSMSLPSIVAPFVRHELMSIHPLQLQSLDKLIALNKARMFDQQQTPGGGGNDDDDGGGGNNDDDDDDGGGNDNDDDDDSSDKPRSQWDQQPLATEHDVVAVTAIASGVNSGDNDVTINTVQTCEETLFTRIVKKVVLPYFVRMLPLLWNPLSLKDSINCRRVCESLAKVVGEEIHSLSLCLHGRLLACLHSLSAFRVCPSSKTQCSDTQWMCVMSRAGQALKLLHNAISLHSIIGGSSLQQFVDKLIRQRLQPVLNYSLIGVSDDDDDDDDVDIAARYAQQKRLETQVNIELVSLL